MTSAFLALLTLLPGTTPAETPNPSSSVHHLIARMLPKRSSEFICQTIPSASSKDVFEITSSGKQIVLRGNNGVSIAAAFNWYIKHIAHGQFSRQGDQVSLPQSLPKPKSLIRKVSPYSTVNFMNYCTYCYTAAFWDWKQWEREIDLMAMSGVKQAIMPLGNEIVWRNVLQKIGYSKADIEAYIPSCAYTTWWLMGNLEGEGGPVSPIMIDQESNMAKKIIGRMRSLGIEPILQGFCGTVPTTLPKYLPKAQIIDQGKWAGGYQRPSVLSPLDLEFSRLAQLWYGEHRRIYGNAKYYGGDLFHEGGRSAGLDLAGCARSVQKEMRRDDPGAIWVLQGWGSNPPRRLLEATDPNHLLVEHFQSYPQQAPVVDYADRPWTFTMINVFGGHEMLAGSLKMLASIPSHLLLQPNHHNMGIGIGDEGLDANPAVYDLASDMVWEDRDINLSEWVKEYAFRRYGAEDPRAVEFWRMMAFDLMGHESENLLCAWPRFGIQSTSSWGDATLTHDLSKMLVATRLLLSCRSKFGGLATYRADCLEAMRQLMNDHGVQLYQQLVDAYDRHNAARFDALASEFIGVLSDCDQLFSAGETSLLGKWIGDARAKGRSASDKALLERSARQLVTLWTPKPTDLTDYSYRHWGGLTRDYYLPRWQSFLNSVSKFLHEGGTPPSYMDADSLVRWVRSDKPPYPTRPVSDAATVAGRLFSKLEKRCETSVGFWHTVREETLRWQWGLGGSSQTSQVLSWDITKKIQSLGGMKFSVSVVYQAGNNAIIVTKAELVAKSTMAVNGGIVSVDSHPGRSGIVTKDNVYRLDVGQVKPAVQYLLRLTVSGDGGNDSKGRIVIEKI